MTEYDPHNLLAVCNYIFRLLRKLGFEPKSASFDDLSVFFLRNERALRSLGQSSGALKVLRQFMSLASRRAKDCGLINRGLNPVDNQISTDRCEEVDINDILDELHAKDDDEDQAKDDDGDDDPEEFLADEGELQIIRKEIYRQRALMNLTAQKMLIEEIEPITAEQWEEEDANLDELIANYKEEQEDEARHWIGQYELWTAQFWPIEHDEKIKTKLEEVIQQLLLFDDPSEHEFCTNFVQAHFEMEDFLDFLIRMCPVDGWLDTPKLDKLPKLNVKDEEKEKERLLETFVNPWAPRLLHTARKVLPFELLPKEEDFLNRFVSDESDNMEALESNILQHFSLEELSNFEQKLVAYCARALQYKIWANGQEVLKAVFDTVAKDDEPLPTFCMEPPDTRDEEQKEDREELAKTLRLAIKTRISQSKNLDLFMLDPEIIDYLSCDEKMLLLSISILKNPDDVPPYPVEMQQRFIKKLDAFERRMKQEKICYCMLPHCEITKAYRKLKESEKSRIWMPRGIIEVAHRREENLFILSIFWQLDKIVFYDLENPLYRNQFNKDFKFLFLNRRLLFSGILGRREQGLYKETKLMAFYTEHVNPEPKTEHADLRDYIEEIEDKIEYERSQRNEMLRSMTEKDAEPQGVPVIPCPPSSILKDPLPDTMYEDFKKEMRQKYPSTEGEIPIFFDAPKQLRPRSEKLENILGLTWRQLKEKREKK